jgi:hypothetical protein
MNNPNLRNDLELLGSVMRDIEKKLKRKEYDKEYQLKYKNTIK